MTLPLIVPVPASVPPYGSITSDTFVNHRERALGEDRCVARSGGIEEVTPDLTFASGLVSFFHLHNAVLRVFDEASNVIETH
jgi:hypothetical protein